MPPPFPVVRARLDRALASRDLAGVRAAARALPRVVTLADAVHVLALRVEADDPAFEPAAVRWLARFTGECPGVTLGEALAALEALDALPAPAADATLFALLKRHGVASSALSGAAAGARSTGRARTRRWPRCPS
jgi:hypothetical protein